MARVKSIEEQLNALAKNKKLGGAALIPDTKLEYLLLQETRRLKALLAKYIRAYYAHRDPQVYERSDKSLDETLVVKYSRQEKAAYIYFGKTHFDEPWGESVVKGAFQSYGFKPILIDSGWHVNPSARHANVPYFGHYEGYHFIQKAIDEFNKTNKYGLYVYVNAAEVDPYPEMHPEGKDGKNRHDYDSRKYVLSAGAKDLYDHMGIFPGRR
jgi:hypothetical protein